VIAEPRPDVLQLESQLMWLSIGIGVYVMIDGGVGPLVVEGAN